MLNSRSCDLPAADPGAVERLALARLRALAARADAGDPDARRAAAREAAAGFASLLYTELFRQMQQTIERASEDDDAEDLAMTEGVADFLGMYLPQEIVRAPGEPISRQIARYLEAVSGAPAPDEPSEPRGLSATREDSP